MNDQARARQRRICIAAAGIAGLIAGLVALSPAPTGIFWDDGVYVITAKALATGHGYHYINLPGSPAATHFPPLWPLLLSLVWRIAPSFPENLRWMKLLGPVLLAAGAAGAAAFAVRVARVPPWIAAAVAATTIMVAPMLLLSAVLMSEPLCIAITAPALVAATFVVMRGRTRDAVAAGVLVGLAVLARSAAIVLFPAIMIGLVWARSRRAAAIATAIALAIAGPWFVWSSAHAHELGPTLIGSYGPYAGWVVSGYRTDPSMLAAVIARNASTMLSEVSITMFHAVPWRAARAPLLLALLALTATGWSLAGRRALPLLITLAGSFALTVVWPYAPGRFVWVFFSLYAVAIALAVSAMLRRARVAPLWRGPAYGAAGLAVLALVCTAEYDVTGFRHGWQRVAIEANAGHLAESVHIIEELTTPRDTIATDVDLSTYLYTGRITVPMTMLTVAEYMHNKTPAEVRSGFMAIDSAFHPRWWIASGMVSERFALREWGADTSSHLRLVAQLPNDGVAARVHGR